MNTQLSGNNPIRQFELVYPVEILDPPFVPGRPSYPNRPMGVAFGVVGSAIVGVLIAFLFDTYLKPRRFGR